MNFNLSNALYTRHLQTTLKRLAALYPIVGITGPRQSGKTTLAKSVFPDLPYVSLEDLDTRFYAEKDPRSFLSLYPNGAVFDEVQQVPTLLSYLQGWVDSNPQKPLYVITGSQNFALNAQIAQSLSGRVGMVTLLPLSLSEKGPDPNPNQAIFEGGYPGLHRLHMHPLDFYPSYIQTYLERDIRQLKNIENLGRFQTFLKLCAGRIGQLINFSSLAQDANLSHTTAKQWLSLLEASYILFTIQPYHQNFNKRLVKMPKLYFYDTGLACSLLGLEKESQVETHYLKGALFENLVGLEILKGRLNQGLPSHLYFWRNRTGQEIDFIGEWSGHVSAIEVKSGSTLNDSYLKNLHYFGSLYSETEKEPLLQYLVYTGSQAGCYGDIALVPMNQIHAKFFEA
jgi:predicted AAA+ superfamily ATPase